MYKTSVEKIKYSFLLPFLFFYQYKNQNCHVPIYSWFPKTFILSLFTGKDKIGGSTSSFLVSTTI